MRAVPAVVHGLHSGPAPLPGIEHTIAVASGKGGVGKSATSVNLALALLGRRGCGVLFAVTVVIFGLINLAPGDPARKIAGGTRLMVAPASQKVITQATADDVAIALRYAGSVIIVPASPSTRFRLPSTRSS